MSFSQVNVLSVFFFFFYFCKSLLLPDAFFFSGFHCSGHNHTITKLMSGQRVGRGRRGYQQDLLCVRIILISPGHTHNFLTHELDRKWQVRLSFTPQGVRRMEARLENAFLPRSAPSSNFRHPPDKMRPLVTVQNVSRRSFMILCGFAFSSHCFQLTLLSVSA